MDKYKEGQRIPVLCDGRIVEAEIIEVGELPRHSWIVAEYKEGETITHIAERTTGPGWAAWLSFIKGREAELIGRKARQYRTGNPAKPYDYELLDCSEQGNGNAQETSQEGSAEGALS